MNFIANNEMVVRQYANLALFLRRTSTIRARADDLLAQARAGRSACFNVHDERLASVADTVAQVTRDRYPDLRIPYHSRWRHFEPQGVDRAAQLSAALPHANAAQLATARIDLALTSVLLDAGAGADWRYTELATGQAHARSEGLGVASFHAFMGGLFSSDPAQPCQADATGLQAVTATRLAEAFQVTANNRLVGLDGRAALLRSLGAAIAARPDVFGSPARPGGLFAHLTCVAADSRRPLCAHDILSAVLEHLSVIWPTPSVVHGHALGDCWRHPRAGLHAGSTQADALDTSGWMPFHKLSQWLTYSLIEPFEWAGVPVTGLDDLTGLPEYRNGGLFLDGGVLSLKNPADARTSWRVGDEFIVEWRALTVALLDELAPLVRQRLGKTAIEMPLACVLEGGTWAAGRVLAQRLRGGAPPLDIALDGTVF